MTSRLLPLCLLALSACSSGTALTEPDDAAVDVARSALSVSAAIASASLANDCPSTSGSTGVAGACLRPDADAGAQDRAGCGSLCRQTSLQINFTVTAEGAAPTEVSLPVTIASVHLVDVATGADLGALTPREPQRWEGSQYVTWDATLRALGDTRGSYKLSAPDWNRISSGNTWSTYGRAYRLELTVTVNGQTLVLRSGELMRAPEVVT